MTIVEESFGIIAYAQGITGTEVILVQQQDVKKNPLHWSFPKGHKEEGESDVETALREFKEETGILLTEEGLVSKEVLEYGYRFIRNGDWVEKRNTFFVVQVKYEPQLSPEAPDVYRARWVNFQTAKSLVGFEPTQQFIDTVAQYIQGK